MRGRSKKEKMAYRYTNTDKWSDCWYSKLKPMEKLLFNYLCDNCDIAGFIELNQKRWASDIGTDLRQIEGALKGLARGLIYSSTNDCIYLRNFLKHQKNLPLNEKNNAHLGIIKRLELYSFKFSIQNIYEFIEAASMGLASPYGNGNGNDSKDKEIILWKKDFNIYLSDCKSGYKLFMEDIELLKTQQRLNPGVNIKLTIEKAYTNYWSTEAGWKNKKDSRTKNIDWKSTIIKSISQPMNKVYYTKAELALQQ